MRWLKEWWSGPKPWESDQASTAVIQPLPLGEAQRQMEALRAGDHKIAIVAAESPPVRSHVAEMARTTGSVPIVLKTCRDVCRIAPTASPIILETGDDVALLCQIVYRLYMSWTPGTPPVIIALLSYNAMEQNPSVGAWDINGGAALLCLLSPGDSEGLWSMLKRAQGVTPEE